MQRRLLLAAAAAGLTQPLRAAEFAPAPSLRPVRALPDRLIDITVGIRPFRAQGPRLEAQQLHGKTVVHNYGHGGAGWSLSWGSAQRALGLVQQALALRGGREIAVIGAGAIGLTTARLAQQAGLKVRLYAKERPPGVHSSAATGLWTPDSRVITTEHATTTWADDWEALTRASFKQHQSLLGHPGGAVEWHDGYVLSDVPFDQSLPGRVGEPDYPDLESRLDGLRPHGRALSAQEHPFGVAHARRFTQTVFNIPAYQRLLLDDFARDGGQWEQRELRSARDFARLPQGVIVNCTGWGARALLGDTSLTPVRGQTARLIPQPEVDYALIYRGHNLVMVPRRDGLLVQANTAHDFGSDDLRPDRALSEAAVAELARLFAPRERVGPG